MIPVLVRKEMLTAAKVIARRNCSLNDRGDSDRYSSCRFLGNPPKTCGRCTVKLIKVSHFVYHFEGLLLYIYTCNSHYIKFTLYYDYNHQFVFSWLWNAGSQTAWLKS